MADKPAREKMSLTQKTFNVVELDHKRAENYPHVYSNSASFGITFFDLSIHFGQIRSGGPNSMYVEDLATITMSLEHAKALQNALQETLVNYEKSHGPIRDAPTMTKKSTE